MSDNEKSFLLKNYQNIKLQLDKFDNERLNKTTLLAVSKKHPAWKIKTLANYGQTCFGENTVKEALNKIKYLNNQEKNLNLEWHFIGNIQSNKTKDIAVNFSWVHSVERFKIAQRLHDQRPSKLSPLNVLIEVNIDCDEHKSGVMANDIIGLAKQIVKLPNLELRGLMCIPSKSHTFEKQSKPFRKMKLLLDKLAKSLPNENLDTLSMGMSADWKAAISEGSTIIRIGTDIFSERKLVPL